MGRSPRAFAFALAFLVTFGLAVASCSSGGGGGGGGRGHGNGNGNGNGNGGSGGGTTPPSSGQPPASGPQPYANPAWNQPVAPPASLWPSAGFPPPPMASPFFLARPWLLDVSLWQSYMQNRGGQPGRDALGAFGLGNGRLFALEGLSYPLNTLHGAIGPTYMIGSDGYFGDSSIGLTIGGLGVIFDEEWLLNVRRTAVNVTRATEARVELATIDFAVPGVDAIARVAVVRNLSAQALPNVGVTARLLGGVAAEGGGERLGQTRGDRHLTIGGIQPAANGIWAPRPFVGGDQLAVPFGDLAPGEERVGVVYLVISRAADATAEAAAIASIAQLGPDGLLAAAQTHWQTYFADGAIFRFPDQRVQDWIDGMVVTAAVQTSEHGFVSPMSRYSKGWLRDTEGPFKLYLRTGRPGAARRALDALYKGFIYERGVINSISIDHDPAQAPPPPDWMTAEFMTGRNPVEAPSYLPLHGHEYWRSTGDPALLLEQYDCLKACLLRQERTPEELLKFNGDEPFRWVLATALGLYEPENLAWSSNSAVLFVAAAERMAEVARLLARPSDEALFLDLAVRVRTATEQVYWLTVEQHWAVARLFYGAIPIRGPFEDIRHMPLWCGYATPHDPRGRANLLSVMRILGKPGGRVQSPALVQGVGFGLEAYDGMVPGYYLQNLAAIDHVEAEAAFNALSSVATVTGEIAEGHLFETDNPIGIQYDPNGRRGDVVARYRPWEGSVGAVAALDYLLGARYDAATGRLSVTPHLPNGWSELEARGLEASAGAPVDVFVRDLGGTRRLVKVANRGTAPLTVDLGLSLAALDVTSIAVDGVAQPLAAFRYDTEFGRFRFRIGDRLVPPGSWIDVDVPYLPN